MIPFSPAVEAVLERARVALLTCDLDDLHRKASTFTVGGTLEAFDKGTFLSHRFVDGRALATALEARVPSVLAFACQLLETVDRDRAFAIASEMPAASGDGPLDAFGQRSANRVLGAQPDRLSFERLLDLGARGFVDVNAGFRVRARPELSDAAAVRALFDRVEREPKPATFLGGARAGLVRQAIDDGDAEIVARLVAVARDAQHPFADEAFHALAAGPFDAQRQPTGGDEATLAPFLADLPSEAEASAEVDDRRRKMAFQALLSLRDVEPALHWFAARLASASIDGWALTALLSKLSRAKHRGALAGDDARAIGVGLGLLGSPVHRDAAKALLGELDRKAVTKALAAAGIEAPAKVSPPRVPVPKKLDLLKRYRSGEHEAVWIELRALGATARDPAVREEAITVARETMQRAAKNLDRIVATLKKRAKFRFKVDEPVVVQKNGPKKLDALEKAIKAPLPLSVRAFYEVIDSVNLGVHPDALVDTFEGIEEDIGDKGPLIVRPLAVITKELKEVQAKNAKTLKQLQDPLVIKLAPQLEAKNDPDSAAAGRMEWAVSVPEEAADVRFDERHTKGWFVDLLRDYVKHGGFLLEADAATLTLLNEGYEPF